MSYRKVIQIVVAGEHVDRLHALASDGTVWQHQPGYPGRWHQIDTSSITETPPPPLGPSP